MRRWQDNAVNLDIYLAEKEGVDDKIDVNRVHILVLRSEVQAFIGKSETGVWKEEAKFASNWSTTIHGDSFGDLSHGSFNH